MTMTTSALHTSRQRTTPLQHQWNDRWRQIMMSIQRQQSSTTRPLGVSESAYLRKAVPRCGRDRKFSAQQLLTCRCSSSRYDNGHGRFRMSTNSLSARSCSCQSGKNVWSTTTTTTTRTFTTTSSSSSSPSSSGQDPSVSSPLPPPACDIVKGPSLLRTSVHRPRPSLLYLPALRSLPFWTQQQQHSPASSSISDDNNNNNSNSSNAHRGRPLTTTTTTKVAYQDPSLTWVVNHFESNWEVILEEYKRVAPTLSSDYQTDTEHSTAPPSSSSGRQGGGGGQLHEGSWDWHSYMLKGQRQDRFVQKFPQTASLLQQVRDKGLLFENVPFGYAFFSTLHGNSRIGAHSAPMNFRIRLHLPLIVPDGDGDDSQLACGIRVGSVERPWITGRAMLLDDSYNHQVWNNTNTTRVLLLVDLWHPDITALERRDIVALFEHAKEKGWWNAK